MESQSQGLMADCWRPSLSRDTDRVDALDLVSKSEGKCEYRLAASIYRLRFNQHSAGVHISRVVRTTISAQRADK